MPDCDENIALRYVMPKNSRDKHNQCVTSCAA